MLKLLRFSFCGAYVVGAALFGVGLVAQIGPATAAGGALFISAGGALLGTQA